ncbi:GIY-YIG nuclease family protein [Paenibacillus sp. EPM92]|uniref:GIY-YIG nuclease family protein n=1 Tax=Paenibacillus sp. EPM92 TaxID=1561195 RepID=UPI0019168E8D|nr:GIY-YIG nuclease family protein [Paenibacillus sp. EPM92]
MIHFGVKVNGGKNGLRLTRENYAVVSKKNSLNIKLSIDIYDDVNGEYTDAWCKKQLADCLENFDLNMKYFSLLDKDKFHGEINTFLHRNRGFSEVTDLNEYSEKSGYYMMILDEYCQLYVGTTKDIKLRIQQHWRAKKPFDRLLFPMGSVDTSLLSIDSFKALDTTRIYAYVTPTTYNNEDDYIQQFSNEFICNRMAGGRITGGLLQAIGMRKSRTLISK